MTHTPWNSLCRASALSLCVEFAPVPRTLRFVGRRPLFDVASDLIPPPRAGVSFAVRSLVERPVDDELSRRCDVWVWWTLALDSDYDHEFGAFRDEIREMYPGVFLGKMYALPGWGNTGWTRM